MLIKIKVICRAKKTSIKQLSPEEYKVHLTAAPIDGKANSTLLALLAVYFGVTQSRVEIKRGEKSQHKIVEIL